MIENLYAAVPMALRILYGWGKNSLEDGTIQAVEYKRLGLTVLRLGALGVCLYFGMDGLGYDLTMSDSVTLSALLDIVRSDFLKKK